MKDAVIVEAVRTPMGRHGGIFKDVRTDDLGAFVIAKLIEKTGINKEEIEDVYFGCTNQARGFTQRGAQRFFACRFALHDSRRYRELFMRLRSRSHQLSGTGCPDRTRRSFRRRGRREYDSWPLGDGEAGKSLPARRRDDVR